MGGASDHTGTLLTFARNLSTPSTPPNATPSNSTGSSPEWESLPISLEFLANLQWLRERHPRVFASLERTAADMRGYYELHDTR